MMVFGRNFWSIAVALCLAGGIGGPAGAQTLEAITADELEIVLSDAGLSPAMTQDAATGAPVAKGAMGETIFWVRALDCSGADKSCENLVLFANFNLGRPLTAKDYQVINHYNESQVFGRAYVIAGENKVGVDYVIELGGGVTQDHLTKNISRWADVIASFIEKFREGQASS